MVKGKFLGAKFLRFVSCFLKIFAVLRENSHVSLPRVGRNYTSFMLLKWLRRAGDEEKRPCLPRSNGVPGLRSSAMKAANDYLH